MKVTAEEFDRMFDDGEDIDHLIDWESGRRPDFKNKSSCHSRESGNPEGNERLDSRFRGNDKK